MSDYGSPMGVTPPGQTTARRNVAGPADEATRKAALKSLEARSQGEARRSNTPGRGTSQGSKSVFDTIRDKQYSDMKAGEGE